uniref:endogenous retrovirus group K member 7 Pro protein-like n=1 Tax=Jaculus jaculus TaxID=51337 RepID=UPI001E1B120F|nr:endogenous retrovirus group K member 7 Pro protein-like [Jaculus jaculus]
MFSGFDTGADRSIIKLDSWPKSWPLQRSSQTLQGLGYAETPQMSAKELAWYTDEGQKGRIQPFVLAVPINFWGRDVQSQLRLRLTNDYLEASKNMMKIQGFVPEQGLGKFLQGRPDSIIPKEKLDRCGLGFS